MKSQLMTEYFQQMERQREAFYHDQDVDFSRAFIRPFPDKWSIGETLYHLVLISRFFRRLSSVYIPVLQPVAYLRRKNPYPTEIHNIYREYNIKKQRPMNAPKLIVPPPGLAEKYNFEEIKEMLSFETVKLRMDLHHIKQDIAGQIYYPDPVAHCPNVIQSVQLLAIHEQHHFNLVRKYESMT
ncbi:DinB family protein [Virgibacillus siamensis]|uniref:DinB family protein n=1 Tax=Virgibacillus siamensis TaxID=480071 RepID=UPI00158BC298|nr:DinB family protein [Virgibacillus siamensis]